MMRLPANKEKPAVPMATPSKSAPKPEPLNAPVASVAPKAASSAPAASTAPPAKVPAAAASKSAPASKPVRKAKPAALKRVARVELNCTPGRKEQIRNTAAALGLSDSDYLLLCEEEGCRKLLHHVVDFWDIRLKVLEEAIRQRQDPPPETS